MERAFVTGGSGFIGGKLIRRLVEEGVAVRALARSESAVAKVSDAGAEPVRGDLDDLASLRAGAEGCDVAFHSAAMLGDWGDPAEFERVNVEGTRNVVGAARDAGARRVVHVGTEAALMGGHPLVEVDERAPLQPRSPALYSATKARAEIAVLAQAGRGIETVVVRPRLVWGAGDTTILPTLAGMVRAGRFAWVGGGRHRTSTTHVDNVVEGLVLGARKGTSGAAYFVTDGRDAIFRDFVTRLLATQGIEPPDRSIPAPVAGAVAALGEAAWRRLPLPGQPPLTYLAYWLTAQEATIDITRARTDLGYRPVRSVEEGMEELQRA